MATTTRVLDANVNGTVYTSNANDALEALDTCHSGATAPTDEVANGKLWLDTSTTPGVLKIYNNAAWVAVSSGSTPADLLTDIKTVDGAGSGLDADLLDGSHASDFYLATNPSGYTTNVGSITGVTAGSGMTGGGTTGAVTLTHADTSAQASVNNTGSTYIQDVTLDGFGHVTALVSSTVPAPNFGTEFISNTVISSGASEVVFTGLSNTLYSEYFFVLSYLLPVTNNGVLTADLSDNNGSTWDTSYYEVGNTSTRNYMSLSDGSSSATYVGNVGLEAGFTGRVALYLSSSNSRRTYVKSSGAWWDGSSTSTLRSFDSAFSSTGFKNYNAIKFYFTLFGGTFESGTISMYGVKKS